MVRDILSHESTPGPSARRKPEDDLDCNRLSKKPRTRVSYSCGECHRRKQKCDRQMPCSHCVARKVPELCKPYTPGKSDQDIHVRLARLEHIIENALPHQWSQSQSGSDGNDPNDKNRSMSPADDGYPSQPEDEDLSGGIFARGTWYGRSATMAFPTVIERLEHMVPSRDPATPSIGTTVDRIEPYVLQLEQTSSQATGTEASTAEGLQFLIRDCGVSPQRLSDLFNELPIRKFCNELIDYYFTAINWTRYPISEREFRTSYANLWTESTPIVNPNNIRFLPLLFMVLAISTKLAPDNIGGHERTRRLTATRFYWSSRRCLLILAAAQPDCIEMILTRLLSARFLMLDRRPTEAWSQLGAAVRTAQALGIHRDGADMGMDWLQVERRRRIWANLYHADRSIALVLGRPPAIQDSYTSTLPPSNFEVHASFNKDGVALPLTTPTRVTFLILRHGLAQIMGRISDFYQNVQSPRHYADLLAIDDALLEYARSLPPHFQFDPDTSLDESHSYIAVQRFILVTEFCFVRICLHRPYLLRRLDSDRYGRSRAACFESTLKDYHLRQEYMKMKSVWDPVISAYREFQASMIAGIYVVLYPNGKDAANMRKLMDNFLREDRMPESMDELTRREIKIIQFLKNRGASIAENAENIAIDPLLQAQSNPSPQQSSPPYTNGLPSSTFAPHPPASPATASYPSAFTQVSTAARPGPVQQLQHAESSPQSTSTPSSDEDATAQILLDQWCNIFSGGPAVDDNAGAGLPWATPGLVSMETWPNPATVPPPSTGAGADTIPGPGSDGSDWSYWETLVNQIRNAPVS